MNTYASKQVGYGSAFADTILAAFKTVPGAALITTGKVRLSKDPTFNPTPLSAIADLTPMEADYSGYASGGIAVVMSAPLNLSTVCRGLIISALFLDTTGSPNIENTVYGYWIDDATNVVAFERFVGGQTAGFAGTGDFLALTVLLPVQLSQATS